MMRGGAARVAERGLLAAADETPASTLFDEIVSQEGLYAISTAERKQLGVTLARAAIEHHLESNRAFRAYCSRQGFDASHVASSEDLARVPLLPTSLFKIKPELTLSDDARDVLLTTSSGTQGRISTVPRDDVTLMRFFAGISAAVREMLGLRTQAGWFFNLGPPTAADPHLWIAYVMAGVGLAYGGDCYVGDGGIQFERLLPDLRETEPPHVIVGPPPLILDLVQHLESHGPLRSTPGSFVVTIGGWKRRSGERIPRGEFEERTAAALGLGDVSGIRDTYNMVELNSVLFECHAKRKHAPPWLTVYTRAPKTLEPLSHGETGILSFVDSSARSYPAFVLSDDIGRVESGRCACGAEGDSAVVERRISSIEARGCALKMDSERGSAGAPTWRRTRRG